MKRLEVYIISGILIVATFVAWTFSERFKDEQPVIKNKTYKILETWELPNILEEVSGIAWLGNDEIATVEDEDGIIFIYNLKAKKITEEIRFAGDGDFEELVVDDHTAYILRSDGKLYEVTNFRTKKKQIKSYNLSRFKNSNMEAMALDKDNRRLLLIAKDKDPDGKDYKGIYSFSLSDKELSKKPVMMIDMQSDSLKKFVKKKAYKTLRPSALSIHPQSGDIYLLEGVRPKLLVLSSRGEVKNIHLFDKNEFAQAEGLTFSPSGDLYISNEGNSKPANILKVKLKTE